MSVEPVELSVSPEVELSSVVVPSSVLVVVASVDTVVLSVVTSVVTSIVGSVETSDVIEGSVVALVELADIPVVVVVVDPLLVPSVAASLSFVVSSAPQLAAPSATTSASQCGSGARECRICAAQNGHAVASRRSGREQLGHACMRRA